MQVIHTAGTYKTQQTIGAKSTETMTQFNIAYYEKRDPADITYDEYKTFTKDNIEQLYPKDTMPKENEKANSLLIMVIGTDDEILNKVLFDKEIQSYNSEFAKKTSQMMKEIAVSKNEKTISAEELFQVFEYNKQDAQVLIDHYGYTPEDKQYQYMQSMISYEESIKKEYEKRVQEKNSILASYTNNNQATQNSIAKAQEEKNEQEKIEKQNSTKALEEESDEDGRETLRRLMEDIRSVLRTGFTVSELEYIEKLLEEIRKLISEKEEGNDNISDSDIEKLIKAIEKELLVLEKKINGVVIIEKDDEPNSNDNETSFNQSDTDFELRLDVIQKKLDNMKNGKDTQSIDKTKEDD
ncbi:MAG: hypothetical protein RBR07_07545 [Arcobacteraceae bacterium]|nr:hypothetical protein [Arcobacteraceae bacterium]